MRTVEHLALLTSIAVWVAFVCVRAWVLVCVWKRARVCAMCKIARAAKMPSSATTARGPGARAEARSEAGPRLDRAAGDVAGPAGRGETEVRDPRRQAPAPAASKAA